jgi:integrase
MDISQLKRKEISCYKSSDLWSQEDDSLFLKWVTNKRDRCYHTMARDLSARPHEILNLKIKDIAFKNIEDGKQYAEVLVNGKTGSRHIPLIQSIPYIKEWLSNHPSRNNPNSPLFIGLSKNSMGRRLNTGAYIKSIKYTKKSSFQSCLLKVQQYRNIGIKENDNNSDTNKTNLIRIINDRKILEFLLSHNGREIMHRMALEV